jgi:polar amino acid transport system permease protein
MSFDLLARYWPQLLEGLLVTLELVGISFVLGALLALPVTAARLSTNRIVGAIAFGYVYFFRGTPILAQLFLVYYGAGQFRPALDSVGLWVFFRDAFNCALFTFTLNTAAYQAEIYRGAIRSVPVGQWEAARALGLARVPLLWKVVLPQAAVVALRPLGNELILLIKASAVASIVTVLDLMGETRRAFSRSYDMAIYFYAAILYLAMVETIRRLWNRLEARLTRHLAREPGRAGVAKAADLVPATH